MTPASIRNNNPGACYPGPSAKKFGSTSFETLKSQDGVHKIATFPTAVHGAAAMFDLLMNGKPLVGAYRYRDQTLRNAIKTWCGEYHLASYIELVTKSCDLKADDKLTVEVIQDPTKAIALAKAMAKQEAGKDFPLTDEQWQQAHSMAFAKAVAPGWSPTNDTPTRNPEDKRDDAVRLGLKLALTGATLATGGTAVTNAPPVASTAAKQATPDLVDMLSGFLASGHKLAGLATKENAVLMAFGAAAYLATVYLLPRLGIGGKQ